MAAIRNYLSLVKFSHTVFAMPFALIGFFLAWAHIEGRQWNLNQTFGWEQPESKPALTGPDFLPADSEVNLWLKLALIIACMVFARSAAMAFNRWLDRDIDALNPRTAVREVPRGVITARSALLFTIVNSILFIGATFFINKICFYLSPVALLVILGYSYTKRFTSLCHLVLGLGLALAPMGAYLAVTGVFHWLPILFSLAVLFWVSGFDIIYSLQDEDFDKSQQLYSIPVVLGKDRALFVSEILHLFCATCVVVAGKLGSFGELYWIGVIVFGGMLISQHMIVTPTDLRRVNVAFMTTNGIASVVFASFVIADLLIH